MPQASRAHHIFKELAEGLVSASCNLFFVAVLELGETLGVVCLC
jgi:hypothetical protein